MFCIIYFKIYLHVPTFFTNFCLFFSYFKILCFDNQIFNNFPYSYIIIGNLTLVKGDKNTFYIFMIMRYNKKKITLKINKGDF